MAKEGQPYCLKCYELLFANICVVSNSLSFLYYANLFITIIIILGMWVHNSS